MPESSFSDEQLSIVEKLCPPLRSILQSELAAGNEISDTHDGWGREGVVLVGLKQPFLTKPPRLLGGVVHHDVDDPHWWKEEYVHESTGHLLVCRFGPRAST